MQTLWLPFNPPAQGGGGFRVLRHFERWLTAKGLPWSREQGQTLFVNGWHTSLWTVLKARLRGVRIVHRVDGQGYGRTDHAEVKQAWIARLAHRRIFQSYYSRSVSRFSRVGDVVVYNPVDPSVFRPAEADMRRNPNYPVYCAVAWSPHPNKGAAWIQRMAETMKGAQIVMIGRWPGFMDAPNLEWTGVLSERAIACLLQASDGLLTGAAYEAGPNHVAEAVACGVPVLYPPDLPGAVAEYAAVPASTFDPDRAFAAYVAA